MVIIIVMVCNKEWMACTYKNEYIEDYILTMYLSIDKINKYLT